VPTDSSGEIQHPPTILFGPCSGAITAAVAIFTGDTEASARRIGTGGINWDELWELELDDVLGDRVLARVGSNHHGRAAVAF
jgi:hypothetical protein